MLCYIIIHVEENTLNLLSTFRSSCVCLGQIDHPGSEPSILLVRSSSGFSQICPPGVNNRTFPGDEAPVSPLLRRKVCPETDKCRFLQVPPELPVGVMDSVVF